MCGHIGQARHGLQKLVHADPTAKDEREGEEQAELGELPPPSIFHVAHIPEVPRVRSAAAHHNRAISHLPVLPPLWAALPSDPKLYTWPAPIEAPPELLMLDESSLCICAAPGSQYNPFLPTERVPCIIYTTNRAYKSEVQLQRCPICAPRLRHCIGPEPRHIGLFNYNNSVIFAHDLLDDYTSTFTSSETPFAAWVLTVSRRYQVYDSVAPFVSEKLFRSVWFAYTHRQLLDTDSHCPECGSDPQETIWDGITLAFSQKYRLPSLCPPTTLNEKSLRRVKVRQLPGGQLIPKTDLRKAVRFVVQGHPLADILEGDRLGDDNEGTPVNSHSTRSRPHQEKLKQSTRPEQEKIKQSMMSRVEAIPDVCTKLKAVDKALATLFSTYYNLTKLAAGVGPPDVYRRLFSQVGHPSLTSSQADVH